MATKSDITTDIKKEGSGYSNWYVGIATDPKGRLFQDHNVSKDNAWWIYRTAESSSVARAVEAAFLDLGCDGGTGGGDHKTKSVYAYRKTPKTDP